MDELCAAIGASGAAILQSDARTADIPRTASVDESFQRYFAEGWHQRDARQRCVPLFLAGKNVVTGQDICTPEEMQRSEFYQDLLASFGFKWCAGVGFRSDNALWVLALQRSAREGPFDGGEARLLAGLSARLSEVATLSASVGRIALTSVSNAVDYLGHAAIAFWRCHCCRSFPAPTLHLANLEPSTHGPLPHFAARFFRSTQLSEESEIGARGQAVI